MTDQQITQFLETCRYLANTKTVDRVISNHAKGILLHVAKYTTQALKR